MTESLAQALEGATRREELALLRLARAIGDQLQRLGAYRIRKDWAGPIRDIALAAADRWREGGRGRDPTAFLEGLVKNRFWGCVLDEVTANNPRASELFFPTIRGLLAGWDSARRQEAHWDDLVQETTTQLWELWLEGKVEQPWALLCTIAKRRFLDRVRGTKHTEEESAVDEDSDRTNSALPSGSVFTAQCLEVLEEREREVVVRMDMEGETRLEVARALGLSEGEVLSIRRAGLRRIWRFLGERLPPRLREVWEEMFKGAKRPDPEEIAKRLGVPLGDISVRIQEARDWIGIT